MTRTLTDALTTTSRRSYDRDGAMIRWPVTVLRSRRRRLADALRRTLRPVRPGTVPVRGVAVTRRGVALFLHGLSAAAPSLGRRRPSPPHAYRREHAADAPEGRRLARSEVRARRGGAGRVTWSCSTSRRRCGRWLGMRSRRGSVCHGVGVAGDASFEQRLLAVRAPSACSREIADAGGPWHAWPLGAAL